MTPRGIAFGYRLSAEERSLLEELTGRDYETAYACGNFPDAQICLRTDEGIDILHQYRLKKDGNGSYQVADNAFELYGWNDRGKETDAGSDFQAPAHLSARVVELMKRIDCTNDHAQTIEFIHRDEPESRRQWRIDAFMRLYDRMTPTMQLALSVVDFRSTEELGGFATGDFFLNYVRIGRSDLSFNHIASHEVAHRVTEHLPYEAQTEWDAIVGDRYLGEGWNDSRESAEASLTRVFVDGLVTKYAGKSAHEDISELTGTIYDTPGHARFVAAHSPRLQSKIAFLNRHEYISDQQRAAVLDAEANRRFEEAWEEARTVAPLCVSADSWDETSDKALLAAGFLTPEESEDPKLDILTYLGVLDRSPCQLRDLVQEYPIIARKVKILHDHRLINDVQYHSLTSADPGNAMVQPECAEDRTVVGGIKLYVADFLQDWLNILLSPFSPRP